MIKGAAVTGVLLLAVAGCGSGSTSGDTRGGSSSTFTVQGSMTLDGESNIYASSNASDKCLNKMYETGTTADEMANCQLLLTGGVCKGVDGYEDIIKGAQVVVSDRSGNNVGLGSLGAGVAGPGGESCRFKFEVTNVPSGGNIYSVEISHRGATKFTQSEAASLAFTLGD